MPDAAPNLPASAAIRPRNGRAHGLPVFLLALLIGVGAHLAGLALFNLRVEPPVLPSTPAPFVRYVKATDTSQNKVMNEAAEIFDPQLLYLPTSLNYATREVGKKSSPQPRVFKADEDEALPTPSADNFRLLASSGGQPPVPSDTLKPAQWDFLGAIGQAAQTGPELPKRGAQLRIVPQRAGNNAAAAIEITWPVTMAPKAGNAHWHPASFTMFFAETGLMGEPVIESSSGVQAVDDDLRAKLKEYFGHHPRSSGYYTVEVGP